MDSSAKFHILGPSQNSFTNKLSCVDAIAAVTEYMRSEIDKKAQGQGCFIDLQNAFDTLDHQTHMSKLDSYDFQGRFTTLVVVTSQIGKNITLTMEQTRRA